ncbi:MAG TPA: MBL fold metallo-hydrolase [Ignavibacteria bacterium]|nr:MBL fold metallo-hydrolase [Ignavibacteria bacterium]
MNKKIYVLLAFIILLFVNNQAQNLKRSKIKFYPINHASFIITTPSITIYVDPVQKIKAYAKYPSPDIILITDIHRDHLNREVVKSIKKKKTKIIAPKAVVSKLGFGEILNNGDEVKILNMLIKAIPMYNITKDRLRFHTKGRGNGYVLTINGKRIYISGDTEDIKEMRELKNIDYAFVCMNLPFTMSVKQAASAVLEFKPKVVYPYHYRGPKGYSDIEKFKYLVSKDRNIDVKLLNWYK